jgi:hypothetical protein
MDELEILDRIDRLEDGVKLCYEEIKGLEKENRELREKGNDLIKIINAQDQQIKLLISIMNTASVSLKSIIDFIDRLPAANEKVTKDLLSNLLTEDIKKHIMAYNVSDIEIANAVEESLGSKLTIDNRRIPYYVDEHPEALGPIRATKSMVDTSKIGKVYIGTVVVTLRQIFKTIQGNIILGVEFDKIDDNTPRIHDGDYIEIHSAYADDSIYFGKILTLKRFKDSFPVIPINSSSKEYGIQIKVNDDKVDFNKYAISKIAIDLYR